MDTNVENSAVQMPEGVNNQIPGVLPAGVEPVVSDQGVSVAPVGDGILPTVEVGNAAPVEPIPVVEGALEEKPVEPVILPSEDAGIAVDAAATPTEVQPLPAEIQPLPTEVTPLPIDSIAPTVETPAAVPLDTPAAPVEAPVEPVPVEAAPVEAVPTETPQADDDRFISVVDENGQEFKAEVVDIFQVRGYEGNNYIIYSFGEKIDDHTDKVYVSKIEELADGTINLNAITDNTEWEAVNNAIMK